MSNPEISREEADEELSVMNVENWGISIEAPTKAEIRKAVRQITTRKAQGADNIPVETLKKVHWDISEIAIPIICRYLGYGGDTRWLEGMFN